MVVAVSCNKILKLIISIVAKQTELRAVTKPCNLKQKVLNHMKMINI